MTVQTIIELIDHLDDNAKQEILQHLVNSNQLASQPKEKSELKPRVWGLHAHLPYYISDDFDAELPDEFWLGEDA